MRTLTILGSTGSIGTNTLDVVRRAPSLYRVHALAAGNNIDLLAEQILEFQPEAAVVATATGLERLTERLAASGLARAQWPDLLWGDAARVQIAIADAVDTVISAIVGVAGLEATYAAVRLGKRIGLANKEVLVSAGGGSRVSGGTAAGRQRAQRRAPMPARGQPRAGGAAHPDGFRRSFPQHVPGGYGAGDAGTGFAASNMEDGEPHHHRFRHPHE